MKDAARDFASSLVFRSACPRFGSATDTSGQSAFHAVPCGIGIASTREEQWMLTKINTSTLSIGITKMRLRILRSQVSLLRRHDGRLEFDRQSSERQRRGIVTLELILALPIFLVILAAVIEFGMIFSLAQAVEQTSRHAGIAASRAPTIDQAFVDALKLQSDEILANSGYPGASCRIIVENDVGSFSPIYSPVVPPADCNCGVPGVALPAPGPAVRVTVCVPLKGNLPDLLASFGFSIDSITLEERVSRPHIP